METGSNLPLYLDLFKAFFLCIFTVYSLGSLAFRILGARFDLGFLERAKLLRFVLTYLVGLRVFNLLLFALGFLGLGFRLSVNSLLAASFVYLGYQIARGEIKLSFKSFRKPDLVLLGLLLLFFIFLMVGVTYYPNYVWDHYTHWLIVPREILGNDAAVGFYEYSRSVAIDYPAHQTHLGAMLLYLWNPEHFSDTAVHILTTFQLLLIYLLLLQLVRNYSKNIFLTLAYTALFFALSFTKGGAYHYITTFYGDSLVALTLTLSAVGLAYWLSEDKKENSLFVAALIATTPLMVKQYAWTTMGSVILLLLFFLKFRSWIKLVSFSILLFIVESFSVFYVSRLTNVSENVGRVNQFSALIDQSVGSTDFFTQSWDRLHLLFTHHEGTSEFMGILIGVSILAGALAVICTRLLSKQGGRDSKSLMFFFAVLGTGISLTIFLEFLSLSVFVSPATASSGPRYFSNVNFVNLGLVLVLFFSISGLLLKGWRSLLLPIVLTLVLTYFVNLNGSIISFVESSYVRMTNDQDVPFPHTRQQTEWAGVLKEISEYKGDRGTIFFFYHSLPSSMINRKWYYLLARENPNLRILDVYQGEREQYYKVNNRIKAGKRFKKLFRENDIAYVLVLQPSFFGEENFFGLYSHEEFEERVMGKKFDLERSKKSRAM